MKLVFQHIPKTAGTTLNGYFAALAKMIDAPEGFYNYGHYTNEDIESIADPKVVFTFLRDPVDRVVSLYRFWRVRLTGPDYQMLVHEIPFEEFIECEHPEIQRQFRNGVVNQLGGSLDAAKRSLRDMIHVGFQETFVESANRLCRKLHISPADEWPRINENDEMIERHEKNIPKAHEIPNGRLEELNGLDRQLYDWARERFI